MTVIPEVKYYKWPEKQTLEQLACNEIAMQVCYENKKFLTGKQLIKAINDRIGTSYSEEELKGCLGGFGAELLFIEGKGYTNLSYYDEHFTDKVMRVV